MPLVSMTGFGRAQVASERATVQVEVRSLNGRFLDLRVKLPRGFTSLEAKVREKIGRKVKRGSLEVLIAVKATAEQEHRLLESEALENYVRLTKSAAKKFDIPMGISGASLVERAQAVELLEPDSSDFRDVSFTVVECLEEALDQLCEMRAAEGRNTEVALKEIFDALGEHLSYLRVHSKDFQERLWMRADERLKRLMSSGLAEAEASRLRQELALQLQKADVAEEVARLESHFRQGIEILSRNEATPVGKHLDFLVQEMAREVNTLGVKNELPDLAERALKMKVLVERLREQAQNIE